MQCGCPYWYDLVENLAPHFDRTTILSFRCRPAKTIYEDHVSLLKAIEQKDEVAAHRIAGQHMQRYTEKHSHTISKPETTVSRSEMPYLCQKMRHFFVQFFAGNGLTEIIKCYIF